MSIIETRSLKFDYLGSFKSPFHINEEVQFSLLFLEDILILDVADAKGPPPHKKKNERKKLKCVKITQNNMSIFENI